MNKTLKALVVAAIVIGSLLSLGVKFWADGQATAIEGPSFMVDTPQGDLAIMAGQSIYFVDSLGKTRRSIDLNAEGLQTHGDYDFFSNGDLLIYHSNAEQGFVQSIETFVRARQTRLDPPVEGEGLYRCNGLAQDCRLFSPELPAFYTSFRIFIDRSKDDVFVADTSRFKLYRLNSAGKIIASSDKGLKFPNQILLENNRLYVANTNHHSIKILDPSINDFAQELGNHEAILNSKHRWPSQLASTDKNWWVIIADNNMNRGRLQLFDKSWQKLLSPKLEHDADPLGIVSFANQVWISDWSNFKISRFSIDGKPLGLLANRQLEKHFVQAKTEIAYYQMIAMAGLVAFVTVFVLGCLAAFVLEKEDTFKILSGAANLPDKDDSGKELENPPGEGVYWIEHRFKKYESIGFYTCVGLAVLLVVTYGMLVISGESFPWQLHLIILSMAPLLLFLMWQWQLMMKVRIGILKQQLIIDDGKGHIGQGANDEIRYGPNMFCIDGVVALLGNPQQRLYSKAELERWVIPRMMRGKWLGQWQILKLLWKVKHPTLVMSSGMVLYSSFILLMMKLF